jgi:hypothetical protein
MLSFQQETGRGFESELIDNLSLKRLKLLVVYIHIPRFADLCL